MTGCFKKSAIATLFFIAIGCASGMTDTLSVDDHVDVDWLENRTSDHTRFAHNPFKKEVAGRSPMTLTCAELVERLGEPLKREVTKLRGRSDYDDPMVILTYDGFSIGVVDNGLGFSRSVTRYIEISGDTEPLKLGLVVGQTTRGEIMKIFAETTLVKAAHGLVMSAPASEADDQYDYDTSTLNVIFEFDEIGILKTVKIELN